MMAAWYTELLTDTPPKRPNQIEKPKVEPKPEEPKHEEMAESKREEPEVYNPPIVAPKETNKHNYADLYPDWAKEQ